VENERKNKALAEEEKIKIPFGFSPLFALKQ
jgi:hypothetical protein